ncbi:hypothetical protein I79_010654 [Cricetulus griseus]|uniref:Uncharacterized protein n=1 Tax=Cricetulus griseus TaxID=10029 RepID=G3HJ20_CRIGR|nr:hypothetical protein I79_010654 [Cricetulus griseus]
MVVKPKGVPYYPGRRQSHKDSPVPDRTCPHHWTPWETHSPYMRLLNHECPGCGA